MTATMTKTHIDDQLKIYRQRINSRMLNHIEQSQQIPKRLQQAMHYAIANGGKRLRPCLVYLTAQTLGADMDCCDTAAMAVEYVHTYSLIHDDLPAMDDDDLRRGQPSCHIAFDEATAILAGDALQSLAFEILSSDNPPIDQQQQLSMIQTLSQAIGAQGMVAGQALDMAASSQNCQQQQLQTIHQLKTGALIEASVLLGAIAAKQIDTGTLQALRQFGQHIGLAFQIQDDILDATQSSETLGKPSQSDLKADKATYASLLGLKHAEQWRDQQLKEAITALSTLPINGEPLIDLAKKLALRTH